VWAAALLGLIVLAYGALGLGGLVPLPRSISSLAAERNVGRGLAVASGLYEMQPFVANGVGLPPYAFTDRRASKIRVAPTLRDLRPYPVVVLLDLATGDGSQWAPYVIHTIGSVAAVVSGAAIVALVLCALAFWAAGPIALALPRGKRSKGLQRAT